MNRFSLITCGCLLVSGVLLEDARADWRSRSGGEVGVSSRAFYPDDDKSTEDFGASLEAELEYRGKTGGFRTQAEVFARVGAVDEDRSIVFLKDTWLGYRDEWVDVRLGTRVLNWSATEAFHPSDNLNSRNLDSNIENAEKIGEPMVSFRLRFGEGGLTGFFMPLRMESHLPGSSSRLNLFQKRVPPGMELSTPVWIDGDGREGDDWFGNQFALRLDQTFGGFDGAVYYVNHNDRTPSAVVLDGFTLRPVYAHIQRIGATATQAVGEWLLKLEAEHRLLTPLDLPLSLPAVNPLAVDHTALALGLEWGWGYDEAEGTIILEGQGAIASGITKTERHALGPFQHDALLGYRHSFNNAASTEVMTGVIVDVMTPNELLGNVLVTHRLDDYWSIEGSLRLIFASDEESLLNGLDESHSIELNLTRHF